MNRTYLEEDLELIQKYFPGAKSVMLHTPFELSKRTPALPRLSIDSLHDTGSLSNWIQDALWNH